MKTVRPVGFYKDYRTLLKDAYEAAKAQSSGYTYAKFSAKAGLGSPNYLKMVIDGNRNLTPANIQAFAKALGLVDEELDSFEALVFENQAATPAEKSYYRKRLARLRAIAPTSLQRKSPGALIESSLRLAIQLCAQGQSRESALRIAASELGVSIEVASRELESLLREGELSLDAQGVLQTGARHTMMSDPKGLNERQRRFLQQGLREAGEFFEARYSKGAAKFLSLLLTAPEGSLRGLFDEMRNAVEKTAERFDPAPGDAAGVYRLQVQLYRLKKNQE